MKFIHYDLPGMKTGQLIEVSLSGNAANVRLLDPANYTKLVEGKVFRCIGGLQTASKVQFRIPLAGDWHVTVDMKGLTGSVKTDIKVLPPA